MIKKNNSFDLDKLVNYAKPLLDQYYRAFPRYTLHNGQHQYNVLKLIGQLLGDKIAQLTELECVILILAIFYHDIGMVYSEKQLKQIESEPDFNRFLGSDYKAQLQYTQQRKQLTPELAEWYCRDRHATRVWEFLTLVDKELWQTLSLKESVGNVSESHNQPADVLKDNKRFPTAFAGEADLAFCGILLRLGDILDFDNTRSPRSVYEFLRLDQASTRPQKVSDDEWKKHLSSNGFKILHDQQPPRLLFQAGPEDPEVEYNIRKALDLVDDELHKSGSVIGHCSKRWRDFQLPSEVHRSGIQSRNYIPGDFRLHLREDKVIDLLTGDNIYSYNFTFIRELLQNAIDSSRMREFHEQASGRTGFQIKPIDITVWTDAAGSSWVRVDDYGMGMNEYVITHHLLTKGNSFYQSDYFEIQQLQYQETTGRKFTPISRFGVGLLSCFLAGTAIEIATRSVSVPVIRAEEEQARLSIRSLKGHHVLQTSKAKHTPTKMPSVHGPETGFRTEYGTGVAVQIDSRNDVPDLENVVQNLVENIVLHSTIPVRFNGRTISIQAMDALSKPIGITEFIPLEKVDQLRVAEFFGDYSSKEIGIEIVPIDLTAHAAFPTLMGQCLLMTLSIHAKPLRSWPHDYRFLSNQYPHVEIEFSKKVKREDKREPETVQLTIDVSRLVAEPLKRLDALMGNRLTKQKARLNHLYLIHNGIIVPNRGEGGRVRDDKAITLPLGLLGNREYPSVNHEKYLFGGAIYFQDELLPNLALSRDFIKSIGLPIWSALYFALEPLRQRLGYGISGELLDGLRKFENFRQFRIESIVQSGKWDSQPIITYKGKQYSINDLKKLVSTEQIIVYLPRHSFYGLLAAGLIHLNFEAIYNPKQGESNGGFYVTLASVKETIVSGALHDELQPLSILPFTEMYISHGHTLNSLHPVMEWLLRHQEAMIQNHFSMVMHLLHEITTKQIDKANKIIDRLWAFYADASKDKPQLTAKDHLRTKNPI